MATTCRYNKEQGVIWINDIIENNNYATVLSSVVDCIYNGNQALPLTVVVSLPWNDSQNSVIIVIQYINLFCKFVGKKLSVMFMGINTNFITTICCIADKITVDNTTLIHMPDTNEKKEDITNCNFIHNVEKISKMLIASDNIDEIRDALNVECDVVDNICKMLPSMDILTEASTVYKSVDEELKLMLLFGNISGSIVTHIITGIEEIIEDKKDITMIITSTGGDIGAAMNIIMQIDYLRHQKKIERFKAITLGFAHSAAFDILQSANVRIAVGNISCLIHKTRCIDTNLDIDTKKKREELIDSRIANLLARQRGENYHKKYIEFVSSEKVYSSELLLREGFLDHVVDDIETALNI